MANRKALASELLERLSVSSSEQCIYSFNPNSTMASIIADSKHKDRPVNTTIISAVDGFVIFEKTGHIRSVNRSTVPSFNPNDFIVSSDSAATASSLMDILNHSVSSTLINHMMTSNNVTNPIDMASILVEPLPGPINITNPVLVVISPRPGGTYFDTVASIIVDNTITGTVHYTTNSVGKMTHTGDKQIGTNLFHGVTFGQERRESCYVIEAVGFHSTRIKSFLGNSLDPTAIIIGFISGRPVAYSIPPQFSEVGDHTRMILAILKRVSEDTLTVYQSEQSFARSGQDTSEPFSETQSTFIIDAVEQTIVADLYVASEPASTSAPASEPTTGLALAAAVSEPDVELTNVMQHICPSDGPVLAHVDVSFKHITTLGTSLESNDIAVITLDHVRPSTRSIWHVKPDSANCVLYRYAKTRFNGLVIMHVENVQEGKRHIDVLDSLNAIPFMFCGPFALQLVNINEEYYVYRTVLSASWPSFISVKENTNVTDLMPKLYEWISSPEYEERLKVFPLYTSVSQNNAIVDGQNMSPDDVLDKVNRFIEKEDWSALENIVVNSMQQFVVILNGSNLTDFKTKLMDRISHVLSDLTKDVSEKIKEVRSSGICDANLKELQKLFEHKKSIERTVNDRFKPIFSLIETSASTDGVYSRQQVKQRSLKSVIRATTITSNVENAKKMSGPDFLSLAGQKHGVVYTSLPDPDTFAVLAGNIIQSRWPRAIRPDSDQFEQVGRLAILDSDTAAAICDQANVRGQSWLTGKNLITHGSPISGYAHICPIPIFESLQISDPSKMDWANVANDALIAAWRIKMRSAITCSRIKELTETSKETGQVLIAMITNMLISFCNSLSGPPGDDDDASCQIIRTLFGLLLTTAGSGANPLLDCVYKLFYLGAPLPTFTGLGLLVSCRIYPFIKMARWSDTLFLSNLQRYAGFACRSIVQPLTSMLVSDVSKVDKLKGNEHAERVQKYLNAEACICGTIINLARSIGKYDSKLVNHVINRLKHYSDQLHGESMLRKLITSAYDWGCDERTFGNILLIAIRKTVRRSGMFGEVKVEASKAIRKQLCAQSWETVKENILGGTSEFQKLLTSFGLPAEVVDKIMPQNFTAYQEDSTERVQSDAEKIRQYWTLHGCTLVDRVAVDTIISEILTSCGIDNSAQADQTSQAADSVTDQPSSVSTNTVEFLVGSDIEYPWISEFDIAKHDIVLKTLKHIRNGKLLTNSVVANGIVNKTDAEHSHAVVEEYLKIIRLDDVDKLKDGLTLAVRHWRYQEKFFEEFNKLFL